MKTKILLLFFLLAQSTYLDAQEIFNKQWEDAFSEIRSSKINYKSCLWNYGFTDTSIFKFNGQIREDTSSFSDWSSIYEYWENSNMDSMLKPKPYKEIVEKFKHQFEQGVIVVPAILAIGDRITKAAFESKKIIMDTSDGKFKISDLNGVFKQETIFISVPFVQRLYKRLVILDFGDSLFFTNADCRIREVQLKINDKHYQFIGDKRLLSIELQPGYNYVTMTYYLDNGQFYSSNALLVFDEKESVFGNKVIKGFSIGDSEGNIYAEPYRTTEYQLPLGANIQVIPGKEKGVEHQCITRPIIFVEGIDFGYKDHETGCYGGKCGAMGLRDLLRGKIHHPYESNNKNAYEDWEPIIKAPKLINDLQMAGYDLIYLDFHNGAEYMENNAMLLIDLIKRVNFMKCSKEEIVVIGASMGGQISRFALSYMEKAKIPHCVRTFLAFDSPNKGAVIPLGLQHFLKYYSGKIPTIKEQFRSKLDRAATRQLLMNNCLSMDGAGENNDRVSFRFALDALGNYPKACRNIALLNGSITMKDFGHQAGEVLLRMNPFIGTINFDFAEVNATVWSTYVDIDFKHIVLEAKFPGKGKHLVEVPLETPQFDFVPGSKRYDLKSYRKVFGVFNLLNTMDYTCFIPSISALDLTENAPYFDINTRLNKDVKNPLYSPFDAFYGVDGEGQEHMMLTDDNINWIMNQIELNRNDMPEVLTTTYNMGRASNNRINSIHIQSGGILKINGKGRNGFGNGKFDQVNKPGSSYQANTDNCNSVITISDNGQLILGTDASNDANSSVLLIKSGSKLILNSGSRVVINNRSTLIIEEGAQLIFNKGASIFLDGSSALLQIDGELHIGMDAEFTILQGASKNPGLLKFRNMGGGYGKCFVSYENGSMFTLSGNSKSSDLIMQVEGDLKFLGNQWMKQFKLDNGKVAYGNKSSMEINGNINFRNISFEVLSWASKMQSKAIKLIGFSKAYFAQCDFVNFNIGIETNSSGNSELNIANSVFKLCAKALYINHAFTQLNNVVIRDNSEYGIYCLDKFSELRLNNVQSIDNNKAVFLNSSLSLPPKCFIDNCSFSSNGVAIEAVNTHIAVACSRFISNDIGITVKDGSINLSTKEMYSSGNYSLSGGNNTFIQQSGDGIQCDHTILYLNEGANNFIYNGAKTSGNMITGHVAYFNRTHQNQSPYYHLANNNYWSPATNLNLNQLGFPYYNLKTDLPGNNATKNTLNGNKMKSISTICYNAGGCLTCPIVEDSTSTYDTTHKTDLELQIYPQPASEQLVIKFNQKCDSVFFKIYSIDGRIKLINTINDADGIEISVLNWTEGMYIVEVRYDDEVHWYPILIKN